MSGKSQTSQLEENKLIELTRSIIIAYLGNNSEKGITPLGFATIMEIRHDNDELLLSHCKALHSIFEDAIKILEKRTQNARRNKED